VIDDEIHNYANAALATAVGKFDKVAKRPITRIDAVIVRYVVAVVFPRRWLKRHEPDRRDTKSVKIVEATQQPFEIADAIAARVHIGTDGQAVKNTVLVPEIIEH
jgi:hypothetical protein